MGMKLFLPDLKMVRWVLKDSGPYFLSRAAVSLFTVSNVFVLGLTVNVTAVGYYSAAEKIYVALNGAYYPLSGAIFPYMAKNKNVHFFKKIFSIAVLVNTVVVCLVYYFSPEIIRLLFHTNAIYSVSVLRILAVVCFVTVPSILLGYPFLAAMGHPNYTNGTVVASALIHIFGLIILFVAGAITIYSIAWMVVITEFLLFLMRAYGVRKYRLV
jgi:PST family polysaccharide transporter